MNYIRYAYAPVLLDDDSIRVSDQWNMYSFPRGMEDGRRGINAMDVLQSTRDGAVDQSTVDQCVDFQLQYLPQATSTLVSYIPAGSTANPTHLFNVGLHDDQLRTLSRTFWIEHREFFRSIRDSSWTMFPISVRVNSLLAIIRARQINAPERRRGHIVMIDDLAVLDPMRNADEETWAYWRLRNRILLETRGFQFAGEGPASLWYPSRGVDAPRRGLRFYDIARVMIERISQSVGEGGRADFNPNAIWRDLSGDFQPDKVRPEMIGIMANRAMQATNWSTRLCLIPVSHVRDRATGAQQGFWFKTTQPESALTHLPIKNGMQYNDINIPANRNPDPPPPQQAPPADVEMTTPPTPASGVFARDPATSSNRGPRTSPSAAVPGGPIPPPSLQRGGGFRWDFALTPGSANRWMLMAVPTTGTPIASPVSDRSMRDVQAG